MKLAEQGSLDRVEWLAESLSQKHGVTPDKSVCCSLIRVCTAAEQRE